MITIGRTTYTVEAATEAPNVYYMTGPRGGVVIVIPFINDDDLFHGFRFSGSHADLMNPQGGLWKVSRQELESAL